MIASVASMIDQFNMPNITLLQSMGYEVHIACNFEKGSTCNTEAIKRLRGKLAALQMKCFQIDFSRSGVSLTSHVKAYRQIEQIIKENNYIFIHCHSPIGGAIGRMVAHKYKVKVIYTAHGFHFFKGAPLKNWLLYYPVEKLCSRWTDVLITINKEDYALAKKKMHAKKVEYVPGVGVDTARFMVGRREKNRERIRAEFGVPEEAKLLLSVGELNENKNHETALRALAGLSGVREGKVYYAIVGTGELEEKLKALIRRLNLEGRFFLPGFRDDIAAFYDAADAFIFPSYREGLSVALMEAMASGLPVICSRIRGNTDLIIERRGGIFCSPVNVNEFKAAIQRLINDRGRCARMGNFNRKRIEKFSIQVVNKKMKTIYKSLEV